MCLLLPVLLIRLMHVYIDIHILMAVLFWQKIMVKLIHQHRKYIDLIVSIRIEQSIGQGISYRLQSNASQVK